VIELESTFLPDVKEQPPAAHLTTKNTFKHSANGVTAWGAIAARAGARILLRAL